MVQLHKLVPDPQNYITILRFLGTTPGTSNIINVYQSLIYQLVKIFNLSKIDKQKNKKNELKDHLSDIILFISHANPQKKIVIFLDSIDQLSTSDYNLDWLIEQFP